MPCRVSLELRNQCGDRAFTAGRRAPCVTQAPPKLGIVIVAAQWNALAGVLGAALRRAGLHGSVVVFQADEVDTEARSRLSRLWGLTERAEELRRFHRQLIAHLTDRRISGQEAAWRCVEAAPIWYRIAIRDEPPFPLDLCDSNYPLDKLNKDWRSHLTAMTEELVALWRTEEQ